jgi:D-3-phosphoglycerate dehydrogenase / 2-oxoglutarate reductase
MMITKLSRRALSAAAGTSSASGAVAGTAQTAAKAAVSVEEEIKSLELLLAQAKARLPKKEDTGAQLSDSDKFVIGTFNAISSVGLNEFPKTKYRIVPLEKNPTTESHAILLRSHKLTNEQVPSSVRAIARCGSGTNNIPVEQMTNRGIPVFNTPGANANAVKELTVCGLLLASRGVVEGIEHTKKIFAEDGKDKDKVKKRIEGEKKYFVGKELAGKRLGVIGLGFIGASVAEVSCFIEISRTVG